jgi:dTDP-4-amino-4,6-dideoxygalactose transaminase
MINPVIIHSYETLLQALASKDIATNSKYVTKLKDTLSEYFGTPHITLTNSGTAALFLALARIKQKANEKYRYNKRKYVLTSPMSFIATAHAIKQAGLEPFFTSLSKDDGNMIVSRYKMVRPYILAALPVHFYGNPCNIGEIDRVLNEDMMDKTGYRIPIVEDACQSIGSKLNGELTGKLGDFGCFSMNSNKILNAGGGGLVISKDKEDHEIVEAMANQGYYVVYSGLRQRISPYVGYNYRMTGLHAALALDSYTHLEETLALKRELHQLYVDNLCERAKQFTPIGEPNYWTNVIFSKKARLLVQDLKRHNIPSGHPFPPITSFPLYAKDKKIRGNSASYIHKYGVCLPSYTTKEIALKACDRINLILKG